MALYISAFDLLYLFVAFFFIFMLAFYLLVFLDNRSGFLKDPVPKRFPKISFLVPSYNEGKNIRKTLYSILALNWPSKPFDIIVIDDGSSDNTAQQARKVKGVRVYSKSNGGKASALNFGIQKSKHEFSATMDADSYAKPDALFHLMGYFEQDSQVAAASSSHVVEEPKTFVERIQKFEYITANFLRKSHSLLNALYVTPGPLSIFRKKVLEEIGGFDETQLTELRIGVGDYRRRFLQIHALCHVRKTLRK